MKRALLAGVAALVIAAGGIAGWRLLRGADPVADANHMLAAGNLRGAELRLRSAVLADPANVRAHAALAEVELQASDPAGAEREAAEAARLGYDVNKVAVLRASALAAQGKYDTVLAEATERPGMLPLQRAAILTQRAMAQQALSQPQATTTILQALALDPRGYQPNMAAATIYQHAGKPLLAGRYVDAALAANPAATPALLLRASLYTETGDTTRAMAAYNTLIARGQDTDVALLSRADLRTITNDTAGARADVDQVLQHSPQNPVANFVLMRLLGSANDWKGADAALVKANRVIDQVPRGLYLAALVKMNVGQPDQALDDAERYMARATGPERAQAARLLATIQLSSGNAAAAAATLEPFVAQPAGAPADAGLLQLLATAYARAGNPQQALATLQQAAALNPQNPSIAAQLQALRTDPSGTAALGSLPGFASVQKANLAAPAPLSATGGAPQAQAAMQAVVQAIAAGDPDRAATALAQLQAIPGTPSGQMDLLTGMVRLAHIDVPGARAAFTRAVQEMPGNPAPQVELARTMALQGDRAGAVALLTPLSQAQPANPLVLNTLVPVLLDDGRKDAAMARLAAAHTAAPTDAAVAATIAPLASRAGQPRQALEWLAIPGTPPLALLGMRAELQRQLNDPKGAVATLRLAQLQAPANPAVAQALVSALLAANDLPAATTASEAAIAAHPDNAALLGSSIAVAEQKGGLAAALAQADTLQANPRYRPASLPLKGDLLLSLGRAADAAAAYRAAAAITQSAPLTLRLAAALQGSGQQAEAARVLTGWLASHPDDAQVAAALGSLQVAEGQTDAARASLAIALRGQPNDPGALNNMALVEQAAGNLPQARTLAQRAYLRQGVPQIADTLGWIMASQNDSANALPLLRQAAAGASTDPDVQYHLAYTLQLAGQKGEAATILKSLLAAHPTFAGRGKAEALQAQLSR